MDILSVEEIRKSFKSDFTRQRSEVLHGVSFRASDGEVLGFLGPNGAGKTTTIKIILGLIRPDSGKVRVMGRDISDRGIKKVIGYMPEKAYFYNHLSLREFLEFCGRMSGMKGDLLRDRISELIELVGLSGSEDRKLKGFSKGMTQRAGLIQAIIHDPDLLILDEPFSGLDPMGRKLIRDVLMRLRDEGKTIFFSSHILPDMEMICDRTCIIKKGRVVRQLSMGELTRVGEGKVDIRARSCPQEEIENIADYIEGVRKNHDESIISVSKQEYTRSVLTRLLDCGADILSVATRHPTLEDVFLDEIESGSKGESEKQEEIEAVTG
ncbi:MAG: ATP-binding cassette domain-containing protein [Candidatus Latescibacteria bacterium]|nr:ATP-binding cassette domain-containing protein [bacterium]MBD3424944.1 ATP-binding cassette domain-containing protein [Candidatus Latescibacterota bacterium]